MSKDPYASDLACNPFVRLNTHTPMFILPPEKKRDKKEPPREPEPPVAKVAKAAEAVKPQKLEPAVAKSDGAPVATLSELAQALLDVGELPATRFRSISELFGEEVALEDANELQERPASPRKEPEAVAKVPQHVAVAAVEREVATKQQPKQREGVVPREAKSAETLGPYERQISWREGDASAEQCAMQAELAGELENYYEEIVQLASSRATKVAATRALTVSQFERGMAVMEGGKPIVYLVLEYLDAAHPAISCGHRCAWLCCALASASSLVPFGLAMDTNVLARSNFFVALRVDSRTLFTEVALAGWTPGTKAPQAAAVGCYYLARNLFDWFLGDFRDGSRWPSGVANPIFTWDPRWRVLVPAPQIGGLT